MEVSTQRNSYEKYIEERDEEIMKSLNDQRDYRGLILKNKMNIVLISDRTTDTAAASMNVQVGSLCDPSDVQGLAHLCEKMLLLGSEKYHNKNDFHAYFSKNGGKLNAVTHKENTNYYFDIKQEYLEGGLEHFSQMLLRPLFNESAIDEEIMKINSEFEENKSCPFYHVMQIEKFGVKPNHPFGFLESGNISTLIPEEKNLNPLQEVMKFYKKFYSSNLMTLSVLGKENLDDLEKMVMKYFVDFENKDIKLSKLESPFENGEFNTKLYVVPKENYRNLSLTFLIQDFESYWFKSEHTNYTTFLLQNESEGSLLSILKRNRWCRDLCCKFPKSNRGLDLFYNVNFSLTNEGYHHIDDIITLFFQYIRKLKNPNIMNWALNEYESAQELEFRFIKKECPINYVKSVSKNMTFYPMRCVLRGPYMIFTWDPDLIEYVLGLITPESMRIIVDAKENENILTQVESIYEIEFKSEKISNEEIFRWKNPKHIDADLKVPQGKEQPVQYDTVPRDCMAEQNPRIIRETPLMRAWFKQNNEFPDPRVLSNFRFTSSSTYLNPLNYSNCVIFVNLVKKALKEQLSSDSRWHIEPEKYGFQLFIESVGENVIFLAYQIIKEILNLKIDESQFQILKDSYISDLNRMSHGWINVQANVCLEELLSETFWSNDDFLKASNKLTLENFQDFVSEFFSNIHVECLLYGYLTEVHASKVAEDLDQQLADKLTKIKKFSKENLTPLLPSLLPTNRVICLKPACHYLYEVETQEKESCTLIYYQSGLQERKSKVIFDLLEHIMFGPFSEGIAREDVGFLYKCNAQRQNGVEGFMILVQSEKHPQWVEERIDDSLHSVKEYVKNMCDEEFEILKKEIGSMMYQKPLTLGHSLLIFWEEILRKTYDFDGMSSEELCLDTITKESVLQFYEDIFDNDSNQLKKLSIHIIPDGEKFDGHEHSEKYHKGSSQLTIINNIDNYKGSHYLYPLLP
ncbi:insulin-degrading enzyme-like [Leptopilina heterotoma]|uniref:insulin-degrading enzyme-like n=1 Tax=Leptopilina heterotoma TaxID=63436 RepID=UPI001CA7E323|nr:insulin-degrading enzyme-like [Leptopilina heterotoma]